MPRWALNVFWRTDGIPVWKDASLLEATPSEPENHAVRSFGELLARPLGLHPGYLIAAYEDPWLAGGHNGLSNGEDPTKPEDPYPRVLALRKQMREFGLHDTPIIMAGGVWWLNEWEDWLDNPEVGPVAFQFGTRPLLTQESPISAAWKKRLLTLQCFIRGTLAVGHEPGNAEQSEQQDYQRDEHFDQGETASFQHGGGTPGQLVDPLFTTLLLMRPDRSK